MIPYNRRPCCVRCAEEPVLAQVIELLPARFALVDADNGLEEVSLAMVVDAQIGDVVLIHAGEVVAPVQPVQSRQRVTRAAAAAAPDRWSTG